MKKIQIIKSKKFFKYKFKIFSELDINEIISIKNIHSDNIKNIKDQEEPKQNINQENEIIVEPELEPESIISNDVSEMLNFENKKSLEVSLLNKKRRKFDIIHDNLLKIGLFNHGKR